MHRQRKPTASILLVFLFQHSNTRSFSILPSYNNSSTSLHQHATTNTNPQRSIDRKADDDDDVVVVTDFAYIGTDMEAQQTIIALTCNSNDDNHAVDDDDMAEKDGRVLSALFGSEHLRDTFFNDTYGRRVAYFPRSSVDTIDDYGVSTHQTSLEAPILGIDLPGLYMTNEWTSLRKRGSRDMLDKTTMSYEQMSDYIEGGGSIIIPITPDDYLFPMKLQVERALGMQEEVGTSMNIYHSGPDAVALNVHYDAYPVFVLQLVGRKDWMVQDDAFGQTVSSITRWKNLTMTEGDLLYIPQGVFHAATTAEGCDASTHATIGLM